MKEINHPWSILVVFLHKKIVFCSFLRLSRSFCIEHRAAFASCARSSGAYLGELHAEAALPCQSGTAGSGLW